MEYGIMSSPDEVHNDAGNLCKMAPTVEESVSMALAKFQSLESDTLGMGSVIGDPMPVAGPVSMAGNDGFKAPYVANDVTPPNPGGNHASAALQNAG